MTLIGALRVFLIKLEDRRSPVFCPWLIVDTCSPAEPVGCWTEAGAHTVVNTLSLLEPGRYYYVRRSTA